MHMREYVVHVVNLTGVSVSPCVQWETHPVHKETLTGFTTSPWAQWKSPSAGDKPHRLLRVTISHCRQLDLDLSQHISWTMVTVNTPLTVSSRSQYYPDITGKECSGPNILASTEFWVRISLHCPHLPQAFNPPVSDSVGAEVTGTGYHTQIWLLYRIQFCILFNS